MKPDPSAPEPVGVYWTLAGFMVGYGAWLIASPPSWYGPSWSYFPELPHNGFGMGLCCTGIGVLQFLFLGHGHAVKVFDRKWLSILFFLGGFVFWTAGIILGAEGLLGHQGLQEAPLMMILGAHKFAYSASLMTRHRRKRALDKWVARIDEHTTADDILRRGDK